MVFLQTRIFVPLTGITDLGEWINTSCYFENVLGKAVCPIIAANPNMTKYWFSTYWDSKASGKDEDRGDCIFKDVPKEFRYSGEGFQDLHVSVRLRFSLPQALAAEFKDREKQRILDAGYFLTDFPDYLPLNDVGDKQHVDEFPPGDPEKKRITRVRLILEMYHRMAKIILHALIRENGSYRFEKGSGLAAFIKPVHIVHNMSGT